MARPHTRGVAILLVISASSPVSGGQIVDYARPSGALNSTRRETHLVRGDLTRIDQRFEAGEPRTVLLRQRYIQPRQTFEFTTIRSLDARLVGVAAIDSPLAAPPAAELRRYTGRIETHLERRCQSWEATRPSGYGSPLVEAGCTTGDGIDLRRGENGADTLIATSIRELDVTEEEVRLPIELLDPTTLMRDEASADHRHDHEVLLKGATDDIELHRSSGNWRYDERRVAGYTRIIVQNVRSGVNISYSRARDGTRRLGWSRPPWAIMPRMPQGAGRAVAGSGSRTILGEKCQMRDMVPGLTDASRVDCVTRDGIVLATTQQSWGDGRVLTAVRLSRKAQPIAKLRLPGETTSADAWRTPSPSRTAPGRDTSG